MCKKVIISGCILLAMVVAASAAEEPNKPSTAAPVQKAASASKAATVEKITYVDANDGDAGNTKLAAGGVFKPTTENSGIDFLWRLRTGLSNPVGSGTVYEAGGTFSETDDTEDCPRLATTVSGLPEGTYKVYVYFWSDENSWRIRADLKGKDAQLPLFCSKAADGDAAPIGAPAAALAKAEEFKAAPVLKEQNRTLWQAYLGEVKGTTITVFVDDDPAHKTHNKRTWYDGIGYQAVTQ
ncbi:MAG: hypothetical protein WC454_04615 [Phycisphaerae bacterium]